MKHSAAETWRRIRSLVCSPYCQHHRPGARVLSISQSIVLSTQVKVDTHDDCPSLKRNRHVQCYLLVTYDCASIPSTDKFPRPGHDVQTMALAHRHAKGRLCVQRLFIARYLRHRNLLSSKEQWDAIRVFLTSSPSKPLGALRFLLITSSRVTCRRRSNAAYATTTTTTTTASSGY